MMNEEICIRLPDEKGGFIYSIFRGEEVVESAMVYPVGLPHYEGAAALEAEYYGGSQAMD
jgi:hypothetical protein